MSDRSFARKTMPVLALSSVIALSSASVANAAQQTTLYAYESEPGDYIGQGRSNQYTTDNATISIGGTSQSVNFSVNAATEFWLVTLAAPSGESLRPGVYYFAERAPFRTGRASGVDVSGAGRGCNQVWATLAVNQIATDPSGNVTLLDAEFTQQCESANAPALRGVVQYRALPFSYAFQSDPGDYIGAGQHKEYANSTSRFTVSGNDTRVQYSVSGLRDNWTAIIGAPTGQSLQPGTYDTSRFGDATHAGLDVFGDGRGCNQSSGTLTIDSITFDPQGQVDSLGATFDQHCENAAPALHGTIHYYQ